MYINEYLVFSLVERFEVNWCIQSSCWHSAYYRIAVRLFDRGYFLFEFFDVETNVGPMSNKDTANYLVSFSFRNALYLNPLFERRCSSAGHVCYAHWLILFLILPFCCEFLILLDPFRCSDKPSRLFRCDKVLR